MKAKYTPVVDQFYTNLCIRLGDLTAKKAELDTEIAEISAQIRGLNVAAPELRNSEAKLRLALEAAEAKLELAEGIVSGKTQEADTQA